MKKILIIDSDIITRRAISKILQERTNHQIVFHGDSKKAEDSIIKYNPDLVLLGINADDVEEIALLSSIRIRFPKLPVIMLSERSESGAAIAIAALRLGAIDFITKPEDYHSLLFAERHLAKRLVPVIESSLNLDPRKNKSLKKTTRHSKGKPIESFWPLNLVTIGGCTGGPAALFKLLEKLPKSFSAPIVIVQHLPRYYTKVLADRLNEVSELNVREAEDRRVLKAGDVWIAPGGYHCELYRDGNETHMKIHRGPREQGVRPSIDLLMRSGARLYGQGMLGVILSGCGKDGVAGASAVKQAGGHIIVQDYRSALIPKLPLSVIKSGNYDIISPIGQISDHLIKREKSTIGTFTQKQKQEKNEQVFPVGYDKNLKLDRHLFSTTN